MNVSERKNQRVVVTDVQYKLLNVSRWYKGYWVGCRYTILHAPILYVLCPTLIGSYKLTKDGFA